MVSTTVPCVANQYLATCYPANTNRIYHGFTKWVHKANDSSSFMIGSHYKLKSYKQICTEKSNGENVFKMCILCKVSSYFKWILVNDFVTFNKNF